MTATATCLRCNKPLSLAESVTRGMGEVCAARKIRELENEGSTDRTDLPFDQQEKDITCERREDGLHFNIYQVFRHHSPTGMEWGYQGSGPADFALNILELFARERGEKPTVRLWDGNKITWTAWNLHHKFKRSAIFDLPRLGGTIRGKDIRRWLNLNMVH